MGNKHTGKFSQFLKYSVISRRKGGDFLNDEHKNQYRLLKSEIFRVATELNLYKFTSWTGDRRKKGEENINKALPVFIIKLKRYIRENLPLYVDRIRK